MTSLRPAQAPAGLACPALRGRVPASFRLAFRPQPHGSLQPRQYRHLRPAPAGSTGERGVLMALPGRTSRSHGKNRVSIETSSEFPGQQGRAWIARLFRSGAGPAGHSFTVAMTVRRRSCPRSAELARSPLPGARCQTIRGGGPWPADPRRRSTDHPGRSCRRPAPFLRTVCRYLGVEEVAAPDPCRAAGDGTGSSTGRTGHRSAAASMLGRRAAPARSPRAGSGPPDPQAVPRRCGTGVAPRVSRCRRDCHGRGAYRVNPRVHLPLTR